MFPHLARLPPNVGMNGRQQGVIRNSNEGEGQRVCDLALHRPPLPPIITETIRTI